MNTITTAIAARFTATLHTLGAFADKRESERGDVPGWVMITLMTASLVVALTALAKPALSSMFNDAIAAVRGK